MGARYEFDPPDLRALEDFQAARATFPAGSEIIYQGERQSSVYILQGGWMCSHKFLLDGTRQIIDVQISGDLIGLRSFLLGASDQTFQALTDVEVSCIRAERLQSLFGKPSRLVRALLEVVTHDEAITVERIVSLSRRDAIQRTAHFLLELWVRINSAKQAIPDGFRCPLSQSILSEVLGITAIHLNRVLRQMREAGLATVQDGMVRIHDPRRMVEISGFDPAYLDGAALPWNAQS